MIELKPCPFCGGKAKIDFYHDETMRLPSPRYKFIIRCSECGVTSSKSFAVQAHIMPETVCGVEIDLHERDEAVEIWNRRCDDDR